MIVHFEIWEWKFRLLERVVIFSPSLDSVISCNKDKDRAWNDSLERKRHTFHLWPTSKNDWKCKNLEAFGGENTKLFNKKLVIVSRVKESRARIGNEIEIWKNSDSQGDTGDNYFYGLSADSKDQGRLILSSHSLSQIVQSRWLSGGH